MCVGVYFVKIRVCGKALYCGGVQGGRPPGGADEEGVCADVVAGRGRSAGPPVEADRARRRPRARPHHPGAIAPQFCYCWSQCVHIQMETTSRAGLGTMEKKAVSVVGVHS